MDCKFCWIYRFMFKGLCAADFKIKKKKKRTSLTTKIKKAQNFYIMTAFFECRPTLQEFKKKKKRKNWITVKNKYKIFPKVHINNN